MTTDIKTLNYNDYYDFLDFITLVFSQGRPHNFIQENPKLFSEPNESIMNYQFALFEENRIRSVVGSYPGTYEAYDQKLKYHVIGNVATHPLHRGKGYMKKLMKKAEESHIKNDIDFALLGGTRERYKNYGYYPACTMPYFSFIWGNAKQWDLRDIKIYKILELSNVYMNDCYEIYQCQDMKCLRTLEEFSDILKTWGRCGFAVLDEEDHVIGYFSSNYEKTSIGELILKDCANLKSFIYSLFCLNNHNEISIAFPHHCKNLYTQALQICENYTLNNRARVRIYNFANTLKCLLKSKSNYCLLPNGEVTIESSFGNYTIKVSGNESKSVIVTKSETPPDYSFSDSELYHVLFGLHWNECESLNDELLSKWFPLELYISDQDRC